MEDYLNDIEAILPDGFDPNDKDFSLDKLNDPAPTTEPAVEPTTPTEAAPAAAPEVQEPTTAPDPVPQFVQPQTVKIRYNHEDRELSLEEAATLAQKGMNYDKLSEKVQGFEAANARSERLAKQLGYQNSQEMMDAAEKNFYNRQVRQLVEAGNTEAMAKFLVDQQMKATAEATPTEAAPTQTELPTQSRPTITPERKAEFDEFNKAYPGVYKLPPEVWEANRNGLRLKDAYGQYLSKHNVAPAAAPAQVQAPANDATKQQLEKTQAELQILKQNQAAAAMAPVGGVTGRPGVDTPDPSANDDFIKGFDAEY